MRRKACPTNKFILFTLCIWNSFAKSTVFLKRYLAHIWSTHLTHTNPLNCHMPKFNNHPMLSMECSTRKWSLLKPLSLMLMIKWLGLSVGVDVLHTIVPLRFPILSHDLIRRVVGACKKIYMVFLEFHYGASDTWSCLLWGRERALFWAMALRGWSILHDHVSVVDFRMKSLTCSLVHVCEWNEVGYVA